MARKINSNYTDRSDMHEEYTGAEEYLYATLKPIRPRPEFVQGLRWRLRGPIPPIKTSLHSLQRVIFITAGIISSLVILMTGVRVLFLLMDRVKTIR